MVARAPLFPQVTYDELQRAAETRSLTVLGGFHPTTEDKTPAGCKTLLLLGPHEPGFWSAFTAAPEWQDGKADPMDRWSTRVIGAWASELGAQALYPFGGPPYLPFFSWALRTGRVHASPIMLLVHDQAGLFVSFRGALALNEHLTLPGAPDAPCLTCADQPCRAACPVNAFDGASYDVPTCKSFLSTEPGRDCMDNGCAARRSCPVSRQYPRHKEQSAYHMRAFRG